jgi:hypothetical protein
MTWWFRKSKSIGPIRWTFTKSATRRAHVTGATKIGPVSISSTGRVNLSLFGFTIALRKGNRS